MEIDVVYTAKDGTRFDDPYKCEEYEKRLGTQPGTVGRARIDLKDIGEQKYVFGLLKVRHEGGSHYRAYMTQCVDKKMQSVVAVMNQDGDFASYFLRWDVDRQQFDKCIDTVEMEDIMEQHDNTNIGS